MSQATRGPVFTEHHHPGLSEDPHWYRTAVFYEVLLRAFSDSNGNGTGDLRGLIDRLDYLQWLGIDCLWLPPFYPSPLRDGGYDVADYTAIAGEYGTIEDFAELMEAAHARGIRVIIDLVMNHTSDQHPWFQSSRSNPSGPYGDFYVWSDDNTAYQDARIIFVDTEVSNWEFDPVRRQYFWHRFFSHQPDLNFENPRVREAMFDVVRFWLRTGVDGFRLDAVPYLFEEEGTNCENLPRTHEFLHELRAMVDAEFPGRLMLAEANQWPQDVVAYYGTEAEPECHMCFHFPVMPRIYYALREQSARSIAEILADTPAIPAGAQWGTFLRNHDELTLEMVSTEERAAMYGWYAQDPRMRANVGIRRRLSPLLDNSRAEIELAHALLLSLPGSPCLYYGDEIGMGDNIWLPDRDAVRTPMQWDPDRNAGFSAATDPGRLYLPVIHSLTNHYAQANVEAQLAIPTSLLHWVRGMLEIRRAHPVFGNGEYVPLRTDNDAVLAFLRRNDHETVLCVMNLAATPRSATVSLPGLAGARLTDVFGGAEFPPVRPLDGGAPGAQSGPTAEVASAGSAAVGAGYGTATAPGPTAPAQPVGAVTDGAGRVGAGPAHGTAQVGGTSQVAGTAQVGGGPVGGPGQVAGGPGQVAGGPGQVAGGPGQVGGGAGATPGGLDGPTGQALVPAPVGSADGVATLTLGSRDFFWLRVTS